MASSANNMESAQNLKRRMKSVKNIGQITKAMELVAATKMRRSQELALNSRPYAYTAIEILATLSNLDRVALPELLRGREVRKTAFLMVTSDKGLAGSFNSSVIRKFEKYVKENTVDLRDPRYVFIAIGQKSRSYFERRVPAVAASFIRVGDYMRPEEVAPISDYLIKGYREGVFDEVVLFSTVFVTALRQEVFVRQILPVSFEKIRESFALLVPESGKYSQYIDTATLEDGRAREYLIEPSAGEILEELAAQLLMTRIYHAILEANASEHSARRVAMKNASENAAELSENLTVEYNKSRQAAITREIIEVTSGAQSFGQ